MGDPVILPRAEHAISRKQIDSDALKVLHRLHQNGYVAYLVGGSVRDLLLDRRPKDFDIGTSAHPYQVKKAFRNCWIIGRRFRLAHVRFGTKNIEVATFRRHVSADEVAPDAPPRDAVVPQAVTPPGASTLPIDTHEAISQDGEHADADARDRMIHRDNTFGTPEEDAFRRDFTINALFYNIADFSIIDFTGGLRDLEAKMVRCIGDPSERFQEDPVRMTRAVAMAARLGFTIDPPVEAAIERHRMEIARSAPARLLDEFYKLLRTGAAERAFFMLAERRLLEPITPSLQEQAGPALWRSLAALDTYRARFGEAPDTLTNAVLLGTLLVPLGYTARSLASVPQKNGGRNGPQLSIGVLPLARRDVERLRQILTLQRGLLDMRLTPRARLGLMRRGAFKDALTWLEIHGAAPEALEHWRGFIEAASTAAPAADSTEEVPARRRRRRRSRRRPSP